MSALSAGELSFAYGSHAVLQDVGFGPLSAGELTAVIGPNASGKSTLFKLIAGLLKPAAGTVTLGGEDLSSVPLRTRLKRICLTPQFFAANAALTVFDVVMMAHKQLQGWRVSAEDMQIVGEAIHEGGIGHLAEAYVGELSGGQAQMVSVAQALIRKSEIYLFDEPTSALDLHHQLAVLQRIRTVVAERNAIGLVALHDLNLASRYADRLMLLGRGRVLVEGEPDEVLRSDAIGETYGVDISITKGPRGDLIVHAYSR